VEPLLKRVEEAARNIKIASDPSYNKNLPGPVGMLSKMGGRLINFYADDISEMLLNDFLLETALELQKLESQERKNYSGEEAKFVAQNLLKTIFDYQSDEQLLAMKWNNPALKSKKGMPFSAMLNKDLPAIAFNLDEGHEEEYKGEQRSAVNMTNI
jgi:hypothetical protein